MTDLTIIYYTSNREDPRFEGKIQASILLSCGDTPIISVSHKPISFGKNICVGDVGLSSHNCRRQFQIGVLEATTLFVCPAESDFLYPSEYFSYHPPSSDSAYHPASLYVFWPHRNRNFFKKTISDGAFISSRDLVLRTLESMLKDRPEWCHEEDKPRRGSLAINRNMPTRFFKTDIPVVTFKTGNGLHRATPLTGESVKCLPLWGTAAQLKKEYLT